MMSAMLLLPFVKRLLRPERVLLHLAEERKFLAKRTVRTRKDVLLVTSEIFQELS